MKNFLFLTLFLILFGACVNKPQKTESEVYNFVEKITSLDGEVLLVDNVDFLASGERIVEVTGKAFSGDTIVGFRNGINFFCPQDSTFMFITKVGSETAQIKLGIVKDGELYYIL